MNEDYVPGGGQAQCVGPRDRRTVSIAIGTGLGTGLGKGIKIGMRQLSGQRRQNPARYATFSALLFSRL